MVFRKHRSSVDHVLTLDSVIRADWEKSRHVGAVFFDIEAAYDTAWRHGILMKLLNLGIRGSMATLLRNFLSDRFFRVRVGKDISNKYYPANGIPQGGVLSVTPGGCIPYLRNVSTFSVNFHLNSLRHSHVTSFLANHAAMFAGPWA